MNSQKVYPIKEDSANIIELSNQPKPAIGDIVLYQTESGPIYLNLSLIT